MSNAQTEQYVEPSAAAHMAALAQWLKAVPASAAARATASRAPLYAVGTENVPFVRARSDMNCWLV